MNSQDYTINGVYVIVVFDGDNKIIKVITPLYSPDGINYFSVTVSPFTAPTDAPTWLGNFLAIFGVPFPPKA